MNERGVTLVELLTNVVILGIISAVSIPSVQSVVRNAQNDAFVADLMAIERAIHLRTIIREQPVESPESILNVSNTGNITNAQWAEYTAIVFGDYIQGDWPNPPFGGYYVYRYHDRDASSGWNHANRYTQILPNRTLGTTLFAEGFRGDTLTMLMLRFDDCETFIRVVDVLIDSVFSDRIYQYVGGTQDFYCAINTGEVEGQAVIGIFLE